MSTLSLIGMSKNSGKTTVLNTLLGFYYRRGLVLGLTSIGRDGEDQDLVTHTEKPRIFIGKGTIFATASSLFAFCDVTREILMATGINTPLGEVIILRARSGGYVQLAGPSINAQMIQICDAMLEYGADRVIVDGAFARKTPASPAVSQTAILCTGAALNRNMLHVIEETRHVHDLLKSDKASCELIELTKEFSLALVNDDKTCRGFEQAALTDTLANDLIKEGINNSVIVAQDASKFLINQETHQKLIIRKIKILVRECTKVLAVTINPVSPYDYEFDANEFKKALKGVIATPVINVMEEGEELYDLLV